MGGPEVNLVYSTPGFSAPEPKSVHEKLKDEENLICRIGSIVVKVSPQVVVKIGSRVTVHEAMNMIYVAQNTTVPIPTVLACYTYGPIDRDIDKYGSLFDTYIFMDFVDGQVLDFVWDSYDEVTKDGIASQLRAYIEDIRSIRGDDGSKYIGSANRGPVTDFKLDNYHDKGPFPSEEKFNNALINAYEAALPRPRHIRKYLTGMLSQNTQHRIVFTHGDFRPMNIMVKDGTVTGILDWEYSGWYPEYWEFARSLHVWRWQNDWYDYLEKILQPYYAERAYYLYIAQGAL